MYPDTGGHASSTYYRIVNQQLNLSTASVLPKFDGTPTRGRTPDSGCVTTQVHMKNLIAGGRRVPPNERGIAQGNLHHDGNGERQLSWPVGQDS
jgi:hypothetical protein